MNDYSFGNFLYQLRSEKGLSQARLGEMLGVTNKSVSKWENGTAKPNTNLLPRIAEILGVTVEELFACKRIDRDPELGRIRAHLSERRKKYAILSSVFLSLVIVIPMLLIEFVCVVNGFGLPDEVAGPLGAAALIVCFASSLVAYLIYRGDFRRSWKVAEVSYTPAFVGALRATLTACAVSLICLLALMYPAYILIVSFASFFAANVFLSVAALIVILISGVAVCAWNIKHLLGVHFELGGKGERKRIVLSELPLWWKVFYIAAASLFLISSVIALMLDIFRVIKIISLSIWFICILAVLVCVRKKK